MHVAQVPLRVTDETGVQTPLGENARAPASIAWHGECCIDSISERLPELVAVSQIEGPVSLDLSAVSKIDTAGLQLLLVFIMDCERRRRRCSWRGTSPQLLAAADITGLRAALGLAEHS
jgi:anti-anti-sigma regulatory factor